MRLKQGWQISWGSVFALAILGGCPSARQANDASPGLPTDAGTDGEQGGEGSVDSSAEREDAMSGDAGIEAGMPSARERGVIRIGPGPQETVAGQQAQCPGPYTEFRLPAIADGCDPERATPLVDRAPTLEACFEACARDTHCRIGGRVAFNEELQRCLDGNRCIVAGRGYRSYEPAEGCYIPPQCFEYQLIADPENVCEPSSFYSYSEPLSLAGCVLRCELDESCSQTKAVNYAEGIGRCNDDGCALSSTVNVPPPLRKGYAYYGYSRVDCDGVEGGIPWTYFSDGLVQPFQRDFFR